MKRKPYDYMKHVDAAHPDGRKKAKWLLRKLVRDAVRLRGKDFMAEETLDEFMSAANRIAKELIP